MAKLEIASIHGRFQPFHNGHLAYALSGFERSQFLYVGITQVFPPKVTQAAMRRDEAGANPLGYFQRRDLVVAALTSAGVPRNRFEIIPFPIEHPDILPSFLPTTVPCLTTIVDSWNEDKIQRLQACGYATEVLPTEPLDGVRVTSGTEIRRRIRDGDNSWVDFVPFGVTERIRSHYLQAFSFNVG